MIDEKKLIEALKNNDGMDFEVPLKALTIPEVGKTTQAIIDKMKECFINLINAQPKEECWINPTEQPPNFFESVLIHVPGNHPLPTVHEGYLTPDGIFIMSLYGTSYAMEEVPLWKPMPKPPKEDERCLNES